MRSEYFLLYAPGGKNRVSAAPDNKPEQGKRDTYKDGTEMVSASETGSIGLGGETVKTGTKLKIIDKALRFLVRLEEKLVDIFSPYLTPDEIKEYRARIAQHKQEMEE